MIIGPISQDEWNAAIQLKASIAWYKQYPGLFDEYIAEETSILNALISDFREKAA